MMFENVDGICVFYNFKWEWDSWFNQQKINSVIMQNIKLGGSYELW